MKRASLSRTCTVVFEPSGLRGTFSSGITVMDAALALGADLKNHCGGNGLCGKCRVRVMNPGDACAPPVSPMCQREAEFFSWNPELRGLRLACLALITENVVIFIPEESKNERHIIHKTVSRYTRHLFPHVRRYRVELMPGIVASSEYEKICRALSDQHNIIPASIDIAALNDFGHNPSRTSSDVSVYINRSDEIVHLRRDENDPHYFGIAFDIGTTSLAAYLCDLASGEVVATAAMINPQVRYGDDVITRIAYSAGGPEERERMREAVIDGINETIGKAAMDGGIDPSQIVDMTIVGNTFMHHSALGLDTSPLGTAPFTPQITSPWTLKARDLGIDIAPGADVHALPVVSAFVGSDTIGVLLSELDLQRYKSALIIDIGTNGEIVLWNGKKLYCTSCATGPAFEGAMILHGMRGAPGAIEKVIIDKETGDVKFKVIGCDFWSCEAPIPPAKGICGSGIIDAVAQLFIAGIVKKDGRFDTDRNFARLQITDNGPQYIIAYENESFSREIIVVTIDDIRAVQLAKGALYAASRLLMKHAGIDSIGAVLIAGSFGNVINPISAAQIGLYPFCPIDSVLTVGNAAGEGAIAALIDHRRREEAKLIADDICYLELTSHESFEREFALAMHFPHMKHVNQENGETNLNKDPLVPDAILEA